MRRAFLYTFIFGLATLTACGRQPSPEVVAATLTPWVTHTQLPTINPSPTSPQLPTPLPSKTPTPTVRTPNEPFLGLYVYSMDNPAEAELFRESGAFWSRRDYIHWDRVEPVNTSVDAFRWDAVPEAKLLAAVETGQDTIVNIQFTPPWAQKYAGVACGPVAQKALDDFAEFMEAAVRRYSQPPYNVRYWEIGNEPDIDHSLVNEKSIYGCWGEQDDPYYGGRYYGEMLKIVYPAVKQADPEARLLVGGLVLDCDPVNPPESAQGSGQLRDCSGSRFLEGIFESGAGPFFDGVSFHAYDYYYGDLGLYGNEGWRSASTSTGPVLIAKARFLKSLLNQYGFPEKELHNNELAVLCGRDGKEPVCVADEFTATKANYIAQANAAALTEGLRVNMWYSLNGWRGSELMDADLTPLPAYQAYQFSAEQLADMAPLGPILDFEGVQGYQFQNGEKVMWIVWSRDLLAHTINLPSNPQGVFDVYGTPMPVSEISDEELTVTANPLYIEWAK